jgi:secondary thiamine-phosphate synthase enzyme
MQNTKVLFVDPSPNFATYHEFIRIRTRKTLQFIDITKQIQEIICASEYQSGIVNIQSLHTTASIVVNENEPLLLTDMKRMLERYAPRHAKYRHDDFSIRTVNLEPGEPANGHAHCKALLLNPSQMLNVMHGTLMLGRWQRIFFVELDRARERTISVMLLGVKNR